MLPDYPYIRAHGHLSHSMAYYIEDQLQKARSDKAPHLAVYFDDRLAKWVLVEDFADSPYRASLYHYVSQVTK